MLYLRYCLIGLSLCFLLLGCATDEPLKVVKKAAIAPESIVGSNGLDGNEEQAILGYHNQVRANVHVPPLVWSKQLAQQATQWSKTLAARGCDIKHSKTKYGENSFIADAKQGHEAVVEAAKAWESEKINYEGEPLNKANRSQSGHYTQMVWRNTRALGCAKTACADSVIIVCNYDPAGNRLGKKPY